MSENSNDPSNVHDVAAAVCESVCESSHDPLHQNVDTLSAVPAIDIATIVATGEPDTLPVTYCRNCKIEVKPIEKGRCPRCQKFLKQNFSARKHPVNVLRRDQLLAELTNDYQPATTMQRHACGQLAGVLEQLESMRPGSPEWQRLVTNAQTLGATLDASRPPATSAGHAILEVRRVIVDVDGREQALPTARDVEGAAVPGDAPAPPTTPVPPAASTPMCSYGCGSLARCEEIKATRPEAWAALHFLDPIEISRRDAEATEIMFKQLGKPSPFL